MPKPKCKSRIMRTSKRKKADSLHPVLGNGEPNLHIDKYPEECGGEITVTVYVAAEPDWGSTDYVLSLDDQCSRCRYPWTEGLQKLRDELHSVRIGGKRGLDITKMLEI